MPTVDELRTTNVRATCVNDVVGRLPAVVVIGTVTSSDRVEARAPEHGARTAMSRPILTAGRRTAAVASARMMVDHRIHTGSSSTTPPRHVEHADPRR